MEIGSNYILNDNLELPGENFIVKKGTMVTINKIYDQRDETVPTVVGVLFEKINGNYLVESTSFEQLISANRLKMLTAKFNIGDCVVNEHLGRGEVKTRRYDSFIDTYIYGVKFQNTSASVLEIDLHHC